NPVPPTASWLAGVRPGLPRKSVHPVPALPSPPNAVPVSSPMNEPAKVMYGFHACVGTRFSVAKLSLDDRTAQSRHTAALARPASVGNTTFPVVESSSAMPQLRSVAVGAGE